MATVVQEELSGDLVSWNREVTERSEVREVGRRVQSCVAHDHEVVIGTFAEELRANDEGFPTAEHGEGAEHLQCHRTPKRSSSSSTLIMNKVDEKQQAVLRAKFRENLPKQNAESKKAINKA